MPKTANDEHIEAAVAPELEAAVDDQQRNDAIAKGEEATGDAPHSQEDWSNERRNDFADRHGS